MGKLLVRPNSAHFPFANRTRTERTIEIGPVVSTSYRLVLKKTALDRIPVISTNAAGAVLSGKPYAARTSLGSLLFKERQKRKSDVEYDEEAADK